MSLTPADRGSERRGRLPKSHRLRPREQLAVAIDQEGHGMAAAARGIVDPDHGIEAGETGVAHLDPGIRQHADPGLVSRAGHRQSQSVRRRVGLRAAPAAVARQFSDAVGSGPEDRTVDHGLRFRDHHAVFGRVHAPRHFRQVKPVRQPPAAFGAKDQGLARAQVEVALAPEADRLAGPQVGELDVRIRQILEVVGGQRRLERGGGAIEDRHRLVAIGERLDEDLDVVGVERHDRLVAGGVLVQRDDRRIAEDVDQALRRLAQVVADHQRSVDHRPQRQVRARFHQVVLVEVAGADEQHVGIVPRPGMGVERTAHAAVETVQHPAPGRRDVVAGARHVAHVLAPRANVRRAPHAEREHEVVVGIVRLERPTDLVVQAAHFRDVGPADRFAVDPRPERTELARAHPVAVRRQPANPAGIDLDQIEPPLGEVERDVAVDIAVQADFPLIERALRLVQPGRAVELRAAVAADVGVDSGLQPHGVQAVGEGPEARAAVRRRGRREVGGADDDPPVGQAPLEPPAVVEVDIAIALRREPEPDDRLGRSHHLGFVDVAAEGVPAVPAHRRQRRIAARVGTPSPGRSQGVCPRDGRQRRDGQCDRDRQNGWPEPPHADCLPVDRRIASPNCLTIGIVAAGATVTS